MRGANLLKSGQATHIDSGFGWESITTMGVNCIHVMPLFGHAPTCVPRGDIARAAVITAIEWRASGEFVS